MPIPTREAIKAYFQTGLIPDQPEFEALIDAMYDMAQQSDAKAVAAQNTVAAVAALTPKAMAFIQIEKNSGGLMEPTITKHREEGCTVTFNHVAGATNIDVTVTFDNAQADAHYIAIVEKFNGSELIPPAAAETLTAKAAGSLTFTHAMYRTGGSGVGYNLSLYNSYLKILVF